MFATFEYEGVLYVNSRRAHIEAALDFAVIDETSRASWQPVATVLLRAWELTSVRN
jgi:hypothetical protein